MFNVLQMSLIFIFFFIVHCFSHQNLGVIGSNWFSAAFPTSGSRRIQARLGAPLQKEHESNNPSTLTELNGITTELSFNQTDFSCQALSLFPSIHLTFSKHLHHLKTLECGIRGFHGLETQGRYNQAFEFTVIGFNIVVEVFNLSMYNVIRTSSLFFEFSNRSTIRGGLVGIDCCRDFPRVQST